MAERENGWYWVRSEGEDWTIGYVEGNSVQTFEGIFDARVMILSDESIEPPEPPDDVVEEQEDEDVADVDDDGDGDE